MGADIYRALALPGTVLSSFDIFNLIIPHNKGLKSGLLLLEMEKWETDTRKVK